MAGVNTRHGISCAKWRWETRDFSTIRKSKKAIVGIVEVIVVSHPDSTSDDSRWELVDIKSLSAVDPQVTLAMIKEDPRLAMMMLVNNLRLSVQPVSAEHWQIISDTHRGD